jgi:hypothetical protein
MPTALTLLDYNFLCRGFSGVMEFITKFKKISISSLETGVSGEKPLQAKPRTDQNLELILLSFCRI